MFPDWDEQLVQKARDNKRNSLQQVEQNAEQEWLDCAYQAVMVIAKRRPEFTADPVWRLLEYWQVPPPHEPRALGPVMIRAVKRGLCVKTDRVTPSVLPQRNRRPITIYRSLVYGGPHALNITKKA